MKKIFLFVACCAAVAALGSCHKKAAATPGAAAKRMAEHIKDNNYEAFVRNVVFTEPVKASDRNAIDRAHAMALRTVHHPTVSERGGVKEVMIVSEKMMPDNRSCEVVLTNAYNNGDMETVNYHMVNDMDVWKVRETPNKEVWKAVANNGDIETVKVRTGHERDFVKDKLDSEKEFVKDIERRHGDKEIIKVLEDGKRHREVIRTLEDGSVKVDVHR